MRCSKSVLACLILSCVALVVSSAAIGTARTAAGALEPGSGFSAAATLAEVVEADSGPRARVRLTIVPNESDASITVTQVTQEEIASGSLSSLGEGRRVLARGSVAKGARKHFFIQANLEAGRDNDLLFLVNASGKSVESQLVHLLVSLDEDKKPEIVGEYIQYQGAQAQRSEP